MGGLFSKPKQPKPPPVTPYLMPDEQGLKKFKRRKMAEMTSRGGRSSTIMSQPTSLGD